MRKPNPARRNGGRIETVINLLALVLFAVLAVGFVATAISTQFLTPALIVVLIAVVCLLLVGVLLLRRSRRGAVRACGSVLAMALCLVFALGIGYIRIGLNTLGRITSTDASQTLAMAVYVKEGDDRAVEDVLSAPLGILATDQDNTQAAITKLEQEYGVTLTTQPYTSPAELVDGLEHGQVDAILVAQTRLGVLEDMEDYAPILAGLREMKTFQIQLSDNQQATQSAPPVDTVFTVYISGNDTRSNDINDTQRSDVNIIATVNPKTRQVLLLSTPRDYFIPLSISGGVKDKLTHAGKYGIDVSMDTLEMLYGINLDYYFKVNFSGFEGIIDALGGIEVDSKYEFSSKISDHPIHYNKGINHLNGEEALYYVRERYSFPNGDFQRGIHQMQVIQAVMDKVLSPTILVRYASMMDAMADCFRTSVPSDLIAALVRDQLGNGGNWNIVSYYVTGHEEKHTTYSAPKSKASVIIPNQSTVETAKKLMEQVRNGEVISQPQA